MRHLRDAPAHLILLDAEVLKPERELMPHGVAHDLRLGALHDEPDGGGGLPRGKAARVLRRDDLPVLDEALPRHGDRPLAPPFGHELRLERAQKSGLTQAGRTHQHAEVSLVHLEGNPVENTLPYAAVTRFAVGGVSEREPVYFNERHSHHSLTYNATGTSIMSAYGM